MAAVSLSCQTQPDNQKPPEEYRMTPDEIRENSINRNRELLRFEREEIQAYVDTSGYIWKTTGTGLKYRIIDSTGGDQISENDIITIRYNIRLLSGKSIYSSAENGAKTFRVGRDNDAVLGLHEGVKFFTVGDSAVLLIPSHLGWGIGGDNRDIPPGSPVLYSLRILTIQ